MSWKNIKLIFHREVRDQLRDRRTLFMVIILPLLLYPAMGIGLFQMTLLFSEKSRTVVILGTEHLPDAPALLKDHQFHPDLFQSPQSADRLRIVSDSTLSASAKNQPSVSAGMEKLRETQLQAAKKIEAIVQQELRKLDAAKAKQQTAVKPSSESAANNKQKVKEETRSNLQIALEPYKDEFEQYFRESKMQVLVLIPDQFEEQFKNVSQTSSQSRALSNTEARSVVDSPSQHPADRGLIIIHNQADEKSMIAFRRVERVLYSWEQQLLDERLKNIGVDKSFVKPLNLDAFDIAKEEELSANIWSKIFPGLLVIMAVTGAFYPAIDLGAGEKERGTMETLLICPAKRTEIVIGKFLTILVFSIMTAILNMLSLGFTGMYISSIIPSGSSMIGAVALSLPSFSACLWMFLILIPLAALFSGLCLAIATFARSNKEGQYYLMPLISVTGGIMIFCLSPGVEITPIYSILPIMGPALLLKQLLAPNGEALAWVYVLPVLLTSLGYCAVAIWWAVEQFTREDVLFREAEQFEVGLWIKHLLRDKEATPSFPEAILCFVLIMFLQFGAMKYMHTAMGQARQADNPQALHELVLKLLVIQQLVIVAAPALFMGFILTNSVRQTFRVNRPKLSFVLIALVLPLFIVPISSALQYHLSWFFPPLSEQFQQQMGMMSNPNVSLFSLLVVVALAPAICEEIAFRGFILSGIARRRKRVGLAVFLTSMLFGLMHMIPQQVFNTFLVGLIIGFLAVKSDSLLPCIIFHFLNNALGVLLPRYQEELITLLPAGVYTKGTEGEFMYSWWVLVLCTIIAGVLIRRILKAPTPSQPQDDLHSPTEEICDEDAGFEIVNDPTPVASGLSQGS